MFIEVDGYVSCSLKNWAVQQHAPSEARQQLLLLASSGTEQQDKPLFHCSFHRKGDPASLHLAEQWAYGPFTQTRIWYIHTLSPAYLLS